MLAIFKTGGKQYTVRENDSVYIEKIDGKQGDQVFFKEVLVVDDKIGNPYLENAKITGVIEKQGKQRKIIVLKHISQKHHRRKYGHRQCYTKVKITSIELN